ncbi:holo-ACP synthase [candidate division KSB1 bacterium]|nr:holo-ACP synthase [candidate division KSB1 bacterium]
MIQSIGADIVDIARFEKAINRWEKRFIERILTPIEIKYCTQKSNRISSMAARFAAKEALIKCLSDSDQKGFSWHEMEIRNKKNGRPMVYLSGKLADRLKDYNVFISMSHSISSAFAMIVLEKKEKP